MWLLAVGKLCDVMALMWSSVGVNVKSISDGEKERTTCAVDFRVSCFVFRVSCFVFVVWALGAFDSVCVCGCVNV